MPCFVIVGTYFGDEAKGKVTDVYSDHAHMVVRNAGGSNAGHTLMVDGKKIITHLLPSGIMRPGVINVLGEGMVIDPIALVEEIEQCKKLGIYLNPGNLLISEHAHVVLSRHKALDAAKEDGPQGIGTTRRGIGPAYEDKYGRRGLRMVDLLDAKLLAERTDDSREGQAIYQAGLFLKSFLADTSLEVNRALKEGKNVLIEGAQAAGLDIDHGYYPYVTTSSTTAGGALASLGIGPKLVTGVIGVTKVYGTAVGKMPFMTEMDQETAAIWREAGGEYGATTGRPRRVGWLDLPMLRRAIRLNGIEWLAWAKLDILMNMPASKVCMGYLRTRDDGTQEILDEAPSNHDRIGECVPIYADIPKYDDPTDLVTHLMTLLDRPDVKPCLYSCGPDRIQTHIYYHPFNL